MVWLKKVLVCFWELVFIFTVEYSKSKDSEQLLSETMIAHFPESPSAEPVNQPCYVSQWRWQFYFENSWSRTENQRQVEEKFICDAL